LPGSGVPSPRGLMSMSLATSGTCWCPPSTYAPFGGGETCTRPACAESSSRGERAGGSRAPTLLSAVPGRLLLASAIRVSNSSRSLKHGRSWRRALATRAVTCSIRLRRHTAGLPANGARGTCMLGGMAWFQPHAQCHFVLMACLRCRPHTCSPDEVKGMCTYRSAARTRDSPPSSRGNGRRSACGQSAPSACRASAARPAYDVPYKCTYAGAGSHVQRQASGLVRGWGAQNDLLSVVVYDGLLVRVRRHLAIVHQLLPEA